MLDDDLKPTPLLEKSEIKQIQKVVPKTPRYRTLSIVYHMLIWACDMLMLRLTFNWNSRAKGKVTKKMIEKLGFLWVKIGQILSLREDFFGKDFCDELATLQCKAKGFSIQAVMRELEQSQNRGLNEIFSYLDENPLAAASIGQVHRAKLKVENVEVVIKIMRPHAPEYFAKDIHFLKRCVALVKRLNLWSFMRWNEAVWEVEHIMREEIDFRFEASNLKRYRKSVKSHKIYVPKVFSKYSNQCILVMEYIPGVLLSDFNDTYRVDPLRTAIWCEENNFDCKKSGKKLLLSFSRQLFEDNLYHADLHPGNIILLKNSKIALIDAGSIGTVELDLLRRFYSTIQSLATKDYKKTADLLISFCLDLPSGDLTDLKEKMVHCIRDWEIKTPLEDMDYYDKSVTSVILDLIELMTMRYRLSLSWGFIKVTRSWFNLESSLDCMIPKSNNLKILALYSQKRSSRIIPALVQPKNITSLISSIPDRIDDFRLFIEPNMRKVARNIKRDKKIFDRIVLGISSLISVFLLLTFSYFLILSLVIYSEYNTFVKAAIGMIFTQDIITHFSLVVETFVAKVESVLKLTLPARYNWLWTFIPFTICFGYWRKVRYFVIRDRRDD